jgi:putative transcriptional regulator
MESQKINRLKVVLVENGKTGKWLAEQVGKNEATVSRWCSNVSQPDLVTLSRIAELLNVDRRELINKSK